MTLKIEVIVPQDAISEGSAAKYLNSAMSALGFGRGDVYTMTVRHVEAPAAGVNGSTENPPVDNDHVEPGATPFTPEVIEANKTEPEKPKRGRKPKTETANISTGGERVDPTVSEADAEQDASDEARETAAAKEASGGALTRDDVRRAAGEYIKRYGMAVAQEDIPAILGCTQVEIPDTQEALGEAVTKLRIAIEENPHGRDAVSAQRGILEADAVAKQTGQYIDGSKRREPRLVATKEDVVAVILAYSEKYDGTRDPAGMVFTMEDGATILQQLFGEGVKKISQIPATPEDYGKAVAGLTKMLETNQFGREAK